MIHIISDNNCVVKIQSCPIPIVISDGIQIKRQYKLSVCLTTSDFTLFFSTFEFSHVEDMVYSILSRPANLDARNPNSRDCFLAMLEDAQMYYMETGDKSVFGEAFSFLSVG